MPKVYHNLAESFSYGAGPEVQIESDRPLRSADSGAAPLRQAHEEIKLQADAGAAPQPATHQEMIFEQEP